MAIASWNIRGLNNEIALRQGRLFTKNHKPDFLFLMETKLPEGKVNEMCNKLGFDKGFEVPRIGIGGGLMALWKDSVEVIHLTSSPNHFSCLLRWENQPRFWHFCGFYGDPKTSNRHHTWELLQKLRIIFDGPWLVMGDFNEVLSQADKEGGGLRNETQIEAFRVSLEVCKLYPLDYVGEHFTWFRVTIDGYLTERLDWAMANEEWLDYYPNNSLRHLDYFHSDHRVLYLSFQKLESTISNKRKRSRFRFENMWIREPECKEIVKSNWVTTNQQALMSTISNIEQCSKQLTLWNQAKFGSLAKEIKDTHHQLAQLHNDRERVVTTGELRATELKLNELLLKEEIFWKQRSRILWLREGDQNTKFFHQRANARNKAKLIKGMTKADRKSHYSLFILYYISG